MKTHLLVYTLFTLITVVLAIWVFALKAENNEQMKTASPQANQPSTSTAQVSENETLEKAITGKEVRDFFGPTREVSIDDFAYNVVYGSSKDKDCNDEVCSSIFYLTKVNGKFIIASSNGDFLCEELIEKGFNINTIQVVGPGCG